ncbi:unnamed protein product [Colletotrichum noveboracense]|uniref:Uncharacterized protein n=1 Tax=Colletotrichum noveboracense TaxID=2664923 RepID=A0A9W4S2R8_9PEZI|nr:unnamed protein product [Colletotrichum noveboracense]
MDYASNKLEIQTLSSADKSNQPAQERYNEKLTTFRLMAEGYSDVLLNSLETVKAFLMALWEERMHTAVDDVAVDSSEAIQAA